jgi:DNA-binding FadR family transcriptional regulator
VSLDDSALPAAVNALNIRVHRELVDAIARGEGPWLEKAMHHHDENRISGGLWRQ